MKLNVDCIRDILIAVEEHSDFCSQTEYRAAEPFENLSKYSHEEIIYHIYQCEKSNLIDNVNYYDSGEITDIGDLSPAGHEFLANMRNDKVWQKALSKGVGAALPVMIELSKDIAMKYFLG